MFRNLKWIPFSTDWIVSAAFLSLVGLLHVVVALSVAAVVVHMESFHKSFPTFSDFVD